MQIKEMISYKTTEMSVKEQSLDIKQKKKEMQMHIKIQN